MPTCLFRYIASAVNKPESALQGHSAEWESWCLYHLLADMGCRVDVLNWKDKPNIRCTYDVVFDIVDLTELSPAFHENTVKILHLTGADNVWRNLMGSLQVKRLNSRRGCGLPYVRKISNPDKVYKSIEIADYVTLIGNEWTKRTYPREYWDKIRLVNVSATKGI